MVYASRLMLLLAVLVTASLSTAIPDTSAADHPILLANTIADNIVHLPSAVFSSPAATPTSRFAFRNWKPILERRKGHHNGAERVSALGKGWVVGVVALGAVGVVAGAGV